MQKLEVELNLKTEEFHSVTAESDSKRNELSRLSSSRNAIQQNQIDFESAQRNFDEFSVSYQNKNNDIKKQIKVMTFYFAV